MALVFLVTSAATLPGSRLPVRGSTSANLTLAPTWYAADAVAEKVTGLVMISSPAPMPRVA
jgi:hypothetical protein